MPSIWDRLSALTKLRIVSTSSSNDPGSKVPVVPGLGNVDVVNTSAPPTMANVPGSWSRSFLGPGQPFSTMDYGTGNSARDKDKETEPRTFQYIASINTTIMPRLAYGLTAFSDLRSYAESVPEVAMCIRLLTEEMKAFVPTIVDDQEKAIAKDENPYEWMTDRPDRYNPWPVWLSRFLYNVLVYDAGCSYWKRDSRGKVRASRIIDGSTIFVIIDESGEQPSPPAPAFQQIIWGVPRMFLNTRQLWYKPRHLRADAPYGRSPIEDSLPAVRLLQNLWDYEGQKYLVGNIPEIVFSVPQDFGKDTDQILEYEAGFNARMSGSNQERVRARFVAAGTEVLQTKELSFNKESYDAATNAVRMSYGILQSEVGEGPSGGLGGKGYAEAMQSAFYRMGLAPLIAYVEGHFNDILRANGEDGIAFKLEFPAESLDPSKEEDKYATRYQIGGITRDEYRQGIGEKPMGGDEGAFIVTPGGGGQPEGGGEGGDSSGGIGVKPRPPIGVGSSSQSIKVGRSIKVGVPVKVGRNSQPVMVKGRFSDEEVAIRNLADKVGWSGDLGQFAMGMKEEQEHVDTVDGDQDKIAGIVMDHLKEDPKYYDNMNKLAKSSGVEPADDIYYGSPVETPKNQDMPHPGANESQIVAISGPKGTSKPAVFKPESGEKGSLRRWVGGALYCRGAAAYLLDRELAPYDNRYLVPVTYDVEIDGEKGSVQQYVEGRKQSKNSDQYGSEWIEQGAVLDYIMGQVDRRNRNYLTHPYDDRRPVFIDNDLSFPVKPTQHLHSSFIDEYRGKKLSDTMLDSVYLVIGNKDLWADLYDVMDSKVAVDNALARAKMIYSMGMIPLVDDVFKPNMVDVMDSDDMESGDKIEVKDNKDNKIMVKAWEQRKHPRRGKGAGGGEFESEGEGGTLSDDRHKVATQEMTERLKRKLISSGGFTYQPYLKKTPKDGLMLSIYPKRGTIINKTDIKPQNIRAFISQNKDLLKDPRSYVGGWLNNEDQKCYLDVSVRVENPKEAEELCKKYNQYAYFDLAKMQEVRVQGQDDIQKADGSKLIRFQLPRDVTDEELEEFCQKLLADTGDTKSGIRVRKFDETKHPRHGKGPGGGEFAPKGEGGGGGSEDSPQPRKDKTTDSNQPRMHFGDTKSGDQKEPDKTQPSDSPNNTPASGSVRKYKYSGMSSEEIRTKRPSFSKEKLKELYESKIKESIRKIAASFEGEPLDPNGRDSEAMT